MSASKSVLPEAPNSLWNEDDESSVERIDVDSVLPSAVGLKAPHCDVVIVADGQIVDLEAQRAKVDIDNKALFYAAKLLCANTRKNDDREYKRSTCR